MIGDNFFTALGLVAVCHSIVFIAFVISLVFLYKYINKFLKNILDNTDHVIIASVFVAAFLLRLFSGDISHINMHDEYLYISHARDIYEHWSIQWPIRSIWWIFVITIIGAFFWFSSYIFIILNIIVGAIWVSLFYIVLRIFFPVRMIALYASSLLLILPSHVIWSGTIENNIYSLSTLFLFLISLWCFLQSKKIEFWYISIILWVYISTIRWENLPIMFSFLLIISLLHFQTVYKNIRVFLYSWIIFWILSLLSFPNYINQFSFTNWKNWSYGQRENFSFSHFFENTQYFLNWFFSNSLFLYYDIFAVIWICISIYVLLKYKNYRITVSLFSYPFIILFIILNSIWFQYIAGESRFYMQIYPIYAISFAVWIWWFYKLFFSKIPIYLFNIFVIFLICANTIQYKAYTENSPYKVLQTQVWNFMKHELSENYCLYIVFNQTYYNAFADMHYSYIWEFAENKEFQNQAFRNFPCVRFLDDKYCYDTSLWETFYDKNGLLPTYYCDIFKNTFKLELYQDFHYDWVNYNIYNVQIPSS